MAELKLFKVNGHVEELKSESVTIEKELQNIIEKNMQEFFGVRFLASEYRIDNGRMDSIGIDENNCPVIFEYKRFSSENVINQGLFYLNWLLEHKANFKLLVLDIYGKEVANDIDWSMPRVICIASDFNKYDEEAIKQINRNVSLIRYKQYSADLLLFELLNTNTVAPIDTEPTERKFQQNNEKTFTEQYRNAPQNFKDLYDELSEYTMRLGDDVSQSTLKFYSAFKKIKNFCTMEVYRTKMLINFKLNPDDFDLSDSLRDVRNIGHFGCGDLQLIMRDPFEIQKAKELILKAYENN
ncbi:MAG: DUF5655 domain-containing protein [Eubacteriales bacterium]|nr:DUF5655 domain-containing protein [Eubacteriales bacterium]